MTDEKWMRRALALAAKGRGRVHPNPMVGAVLVRNGRVVGEGFHRRYGEAHAEIEAIRQAGLRAKGSTLYVNLEPCAHHGKTPPCAEAVHRAGIRRVVAAMKDPNPLVAGKGFRFLKKHRISSVIGLLKEEAHELNRAFLTWVTHGRPYVTLKVASSLDGRTSTITGESKWITSEASRHDGHTLRAQADAIAVGVQTILSDNPSLTAREAGRNPARIIFDSRLRSPLKSRVFNRDANTWVIVTDRSVLKRVDAFKRKGVHILFCPADREGRVDLRKALRQLAQQGIAHLLVEGGLTLQHSFLQAGLTDDVVWYLAPLIIGQTKQLKNAVRLQGVRVKRIGSDLRVQACLPESFRRSAK